MEGTSTKNEKGESTSPVKKDDNEEEKIPQSTSNGEGAGVDDKDG